MTHTDPPGRYGGPAYPSDRDVRSGRHRARHSDAAPDAYRPDDARRADPGNTGEQYGYEYGDGVSVHPMYGRSGSGRPAPSVPASSHPASRLLDPVAPLDPVATPSVVVPQDPAAPPPDAVARTGRSRRPRRAEVEETAKPGRASQEAPAPRRGRAGRNLPAAIGVGVLLVAIVLGSLFLWRPAFVAVIAVGAAVGVWEMSRAIAGVDRARPPVAPLIGGCVVMPALAWYGGVESMVLGLLLTVLAAIIWRLSGGAPGFHRDVAAGTLIAVYVPFLISFGVLLASPSDGDFRVVTVLACVVLSDTGGYVAGVFFGKHPMAPKASPKKSWEGLAGSLIATGAGGALLLAYLFDQPWWHGAVLGVCVSGAAVLGDLAESVLKRDLGVKDMSQLLPGHGGLMDRLDSVVFAAPTAFMLLTLLAPVGS